MKNRIVNTDENDYLLDEDGLVYGIASRPGPAHEDYIENGPWRSFDRVFGPKHIAEEWLIRVNAHDDEWWEYTLIAREPVRWVVVEYA
jgi:hypothetical protein